MINETHLYALTHGGYILPENCLLISCKQALFECL